MTLFIVKIAPKQRSIHEKFLGIVGELSLIRENTHHQSVIQSILRQQPAHTDSSQHTRLFHKPSDPNE